MKNCQHILPKAALTVALSAALVVALAVCLGVPHMALAAEDGSGDASAEDKDSVIMAFQEMVDSVLEYAQKESTPEEPRSVTSDLNIDVLLTPTNPIISVVVPTYVSVAVNVDIKDGTFKDYRQAESTVENLQASALPVRVDVMAVKDSPPADKPSNKAVLKYVNMVLVERLPAQTPGDPDVDGSKVIIADPQPVDNATILEKIMPGSSGKIATEISIKPEEKRTEIPPGTYTTAITMKVRAVLAE